MNGRTQNLLKRVGAELNFALTNAIPRRAACRWMAWFSQLRHPLLSRASIGAWRALSDLDLSDAATTRFDSLHDCFTRKLAPGARPIDPEPDALVSPCDGIVVACGRVDGSTLLQAKGRTYGLTELLLEPDLARLYRDGCYATVRLTPTTYHRFHAPLQCRLRHVAFVPGDTWNVNEAALQRVDRLYCRNERAVLKLQGDADGPLITLVPVAAILVASLRLHALTGLLHADYSGPSRITCNIAYARGDELGWFQHGSTIIVLAPKSCGVAAGIGIGTRIRMGRKLMSIAPAR